MYSLQSFDPRLYIHSIHTSTRYSHVMILGEIGKWRSKSLNLSREFTQVSIPPGSHQHKRERRLRCPSLLYYFLHPAINNHTQAISHPCPACTNPCSRHSAKTPKKEKENKRNTSLTNTLPPAARLQPAKSLAAAAAFPSGSLL